MLKESPVRASIERLRRKLQQIDDGTVANNGETESERAARLKRFRGDYAAFFEYYFPHYAFSPTAKFQKQLATDVLADPKFFGVVEWARGHAKTTHCTIGFVVWLHYIHEQAWTVILVGRTATDAQKLLHNLAQELAYNSRLRHDFGEQLNEDDWRAEEVRTKSRLSVVALGLRQNPRGTRDREWRPDLIVCDDLDEDKRAENQRLVEADIRFLRKALYMTMDMGRGRFILAGNRIHPRGIVARMSQMPDIYHSRVNAYDPVTLEVAWPEKWTLEEIRAAEAKGGADAKAELLNSPAESGGVWHEKHFIWGPTHLPNEYDACIGYIDPSWTPGRVADYKACVVMGRTGSHYHLLRVYLRRASIEDFASWLYSTDNLFAAQGQYVDWWMEGNLRQGTIAEHFDIYAERRGITPLIIHKDVRNKGNKLGRIRDSAGYFERRQVLLGEHLRNDPDTLQLLEQYLAFNPSNSRQVDDGPDAVDSCIHLLQRMNKEIQIITG